MAAKVPTQTVSGHDASDPPSQPTAKPTGGMGGSGGRHALQAARRTWASVGNASALWLPLVTLVLVFGTWWAATEYFDIRTFILPPPADVVHEFVRLADYLMQQASVTLIQTVAGFLITLVGGLLIGVSIASSRIVSQMISPWLVAFNAVPKIAFAPLLIVWLGFGMQPRIVMVIMVCFFPIVLATATGLTSTPAELVELARSLDASRLQLFVKVRFPYAMPQIFVGLKVAMPLAVIGAVIGEFAGGRTGLGYVIQQAGGSANTALAFAAIGLLSIMSIVLYYILVGIERLMLPWLRETTS